MQKFNPFREFFFFFTPIITQHDFALTPSIVMIKERLDARGGSGEQKTDGLQTSGGLSKRVLHKFSLQKEIPIDLR